jgi:hypothetical protein
MTGVGRKSALGELVELVQQLRDGLDVAHVALGRELMSLGGS